MYPYEYVHSTASVLQAASKLFFCVRAQLLAAYSYTCSAAFIRVAAKHVLNRPPQRTVQLDPLRCSSAESGSDDTRLQSTTRGCNLAPRA